MRPRNTLLLLLVLAALGAYVYWVELPHEKREAEQKQLLTFEKDKDGSYKVDVPLLLVRCLVRSHWTANWPNVIGAARVGTSRATRPAFTAPS